MDDNRSRTVTLRNERRGDDQRTLWAYLDTAGNLHIDGQDLGPGTSPVRSDGEYEWFKTVAAADVPKVVELLGAEPGEDILDVLERQYIGHESYELERRLRNCDIPIELHTY